MHLSGAHATLFVEPSMHNSTPQRAPRSTTPTGTTPTGTTPTDIASGLFPHQVEGVAFLLRRRRAVLADNMGLGKTRQAITALKVAYFVICRGTATHIRMSALPPWSARGEEA